MFRFAVKWAKSSFDFSKNVGEKTSNHGYRIISVKIIRFELNKSIRHVNFEPVCLKLKCENR